MRRSTPKFFGAVIKPDFQSRSRDDLEYVSSKENTRIIIVSSYHKEYLWSQDTHKGVCKALLKFKYLDNRKQIETFTKNDIVISSKSVIKKVWMNTKKKSSKPQIAAATLRILKDIKRFKPDIILLGDDNAANHIGNQFIDTDIPVVFWGINGNPSKYGLIDSVEKPGHNITGVFQAGYLRESLVYLTTRPR